ncbi:uncharacterized protein LOC113493889 [Trichoplusia ni]|uniref:Uncharacterized protein LOC113493889 n=1 Tax=Trichoplusia ni TaxID=7111 RepID=A0A7E5VHB8_TRINI|nr:uncharacterized protein LOC113493889 [Trichoplusia ni]
MSAGKTAIYHWTLGEIALARVCKKVYSNVQIVKNDDGLFYDKKVLGISGNEDGSITVTKELCYYVETCTTKNRFWLPYTSLHLAERSRPFYGPAHKAPKISPPKTPAVPRKRKIKEDLIVPLNVKLCKKEPDLNATYDVIHTPLKQGRHESAFKEFVRRGKENLFDQYFEYLQLDIENNKDCLDYLINVDASTEDKFEMVIKNIVSEKEIENYLHQCWRYNFVHKYSQTDNKDASDSSNSSSPVKAVITIHTPWCLVCGKKEKLRECPNCPSSFHLACRREWLVTIIHRKNPPKKTVKPVTLVEKILSSTRTICSVRKEKENTELCPSCMWGPRVGYDDVVWHKLGACSWWPARVLLPGAAPACLLARGHDHTHWPLKYYGTLNHSWGETSRMTLFLPSHSHNTPKDEMLAKAILDACDDYISVYLT